MEWTRVKDADGRYWYKSGDYRIDPEVAVNARSYHPRVSMFRVYAETGGKAYGGRDIAAKPTLKAAKEFAQKHAEALDKQIP